MEPSPDVFFRAADQFGIAIAVLLVQAIVFAVAFVKEWIASGSALKRERARGDEWERLFKKSVGYSDEQLQTTKQLATLADLVLQRAKDQQ
jgi:hypothetical protein